MWHQPCQHCKYTTLVYIKKMHYKKQVTHVESHASVVVLLKKAENSAVYAIINQSIKHGQRVSHPDSDEGDLVALGHGEVDEMVLARREGGQPHVCVVSCPVDSVDEVAHHSRVSAVLGQDVDVWGVGRNLEHATQMS